jgi:hypothetical protein
VAGPKQAASRPTSPTALLRIAGFGCGLAVGSHAL